MAWQNDAAGALPLEDTNGAVAARDCHFVVQNHPWNAPGYNDLRTQNSDSLKRMSKVYVGECSRVRGEAVNMISHLGRASTPVHLRFILFELVRVTYAFGRLLSEYEVSSFEFEQSAHGEPGSHNSQTFC